MRSRSISWRANRAPWTGLPGPGNRPCRRRWAGASCAPPRPRRSPARVAPPRGVGRQAGGVCPDEPPGNLPTVTGARVGELLFELNANAHTTLVLVTHDRELAARCARMVKMEAGRVL